MKHRATVMTALYGALFLATATACCVLVVAWAASWQVALLP